MSVFQQRATRQITLQYWGPQEGGAEGGEANPRMCRQVCELAPQAGSGCPQALCVLSTPANSEQLL